MQPNVSLKTSRIGLRTALVAVVLGGILLCAAPVNVIWWQTSSTVSRNLLDALATQINDAARREWWTRVADIQGLFGTIHDLSKIATMNVATEQILLPPALSSRDFSWLVLAEPDGRSVLIQDLGGTSLRVARADASGRADTMTIAARERETPAAPPPLAQVFKPADQPWMSVAAHAVAMPEWVAVPAMPDGTGPAVAFVGPTARGLLAAMIGYDRFADLLGAIPVGQTGRSFVLGPDGHIVIASRSKDMPRRTGLETVAEAAGRRVAARDPAKLNIVEETHLQVGGLAYAVGLSPLWFQGWQLAVVVPEAEFVSEIDRTITRVVAGLGVFLIVAGAAIAIVAKRYLADPFTRVVGDLEHIERFEFAAVPRRLSRLVEIDRLSAVIVRMAAGLANFGKFIPADVVQALLAGDMQAEVGGRRRDVTVLFADLAGFTALTERLGDRVLPIIGRYLDLASQGVVSNGGTIDKFIGDSVMAFWGAPKADAAQAVNACRAALAIVALTRDGRLSDEHGSPLALRIGVHSGPALVGNVGSAERLNYTALGDTVNLASRLESVNKVYETTILISAATRQQAGDAIVVREVDTVTVYGRSEGVAVFELLGLAGTFVCPTWVVRYEQALASYRARRFAEALRQLDAVLAERLEDVPSQRLRATCAACLDDSPDAAWAPTTMLAEK